MTLMSLVKSTIVKNTGVFACERGATVARINIHP
jgi:hypothetical protein